MRFAAQKSIKCSIYYMNSFRVWTIKNEGLWCTVSRNARSISKIGFLTQRVRAEGRCNSPKKVIIIQQSHIPYHKPHWTGTHFFCALFPNHKQINPEQSDCIETKWGCFLLNVDMVCIFLTAINVASRAVARTIETTRHAICNNCHSFLLRCVL